MPFERPTIQELVERTQEDLAGRLEGADPRLRVTPEHVLARVHAGAAHGLHGHLAWVARQAVPTTADSDNLVRWARFFGVERQPPTPATSVVTVEATAGAVVHAGAAWTRVDGVEYVTTADATAAEGLLTVPVQARVSGSQGNAPAGTLVSLSAAVAGVAGRGALSSAAFGGADLEPLEVLRDRLLLRLRRPPRGGAVGDYVHWVRAIPGYAAARVWERAHYLGIGTVGVFFVRGGATDIFPAPEEVQAVQAALDARRPRTAQVTVFAPAAEPIPFTISVSPDTSEVRAAVVAELRDLFHREAEPGGTILLSHMRAAISAAAGEHDHELVYPNTNIRPPAGSLPVVGDVTW